jgi:hypothetical protein
VSRPLALHDVPYTQHCATLVSQQRDSLLTDCSVSFAAPSASPQTDALGRKRLHFCSFGPRVRPSTHGGQRLPFVAAAAACNADERRPTVRRCHLTTNAESTGNMPTWLRTQCVRRPCRLPSTQLCWPAPKIATRLSSESIPSQQRTIIALAQTLHRSRHRGTRAGSGVLPSETVGVRPSTLCRLAWRAPCYNL